MGRRHITSSHELKKGSHQCARCKLWFKTEEERDTHLRLDPASMCAIKEDQAPHDQEDGITQQTLSRLTDRRNGYKIDKWEKLWELLFPQESVCPSPGMSIAQESKFIHI